MPNASCANHVDSPEYLTNMYDQSTAMRDSRETYRRLSSTSQGKETTADVIEGLEAGSNDKETTDTPVPPEVETSSPTHPSRESDAASVHSAPVVHASGPRTTNSRPSTASHTRDSATLLPAAASRVQRTTESTVSTGERVNRHRSAMESRASNRLSGFFSNLIHRRDAVPNSSSRSGLREERGPSPRPQDPSSLPGSRSASPAPARPVTPPPPLPPPTLQELGLTLSALTSALSPSHFSTPPSSGSFLAPHYLLLCHAQGLDVLPLISPPAPQPYALVRRVSFKSVVVMEQRGVLVAIAGRRDGVRVYALEEMKKAVEWRIEVEVRRERERARREEAKKAAARPVPNSIILDSRDSSEKAKPTLLPPLSTSLPLPTSTSNRNKLSRRSSQSTPMTVTPRAPTSKKSRPPPHLTTSTPAQASQSRTPTQEPTGLPPPYSNFPESRPMLRSSPSAVSLTRSRRPSLSQVLGATPPVPRRKSENTRDPDSKAEDWIEGRGSSDDEAIDIVAAGASGGQALDERTSARHSVPSPSHGIETTPITLANSGRSPSTPNTRRNRPANLDLTLTRTSVAATPPSPTATLLNLRQALQHAPPLPGARSTDQRDTETPEPDDDEEVPSREVSLAQMLMESRIPDLPPIGTRQPQQPIILGGAAPLSPGRSRVRRPSSPPDEEDEDEDAPTQGVSLAQMLMESRIPDLPPVGSRQAQQPIILGENEPPASPTSSARPSTVGRSENRRRRRWSVLDGFFSDGSSAQPPAVSASSTTLPVTSESAVPSSTRRDRRGSQLLGSPSSRRSSSATRLGSRPNPLPLRPSSAGDGNAPSDTDIPPVPRALTISSSGMPSHSRFIPRIISNAFSSRRSDDQPQALVIKSSDTADGRKTSGNAATGHAPPPKLEYVKLPGTKGALIIKAVETAKKSFLAILCGDNGEKVELFAGTYRTALGLSRTFILPDSPRSLELQLQGDDLVEVFLVFAQNVFGLEPATVRVREVRIGRAERRAARRRAREIRSGSGSADVFDTDPPAAEDEDTNVSINIGVSVAAGAEPVVDSGDIASPMSPPSTAQTPEAPYTPADAEGGAGGSSSALAHAEELVALAAAQIGPYTTFQQLSFAPNFPLASIADEYIIPPTYPDFLGYRAEHEPEVNGTNNVDLAQIQFSPPGLPAPAASPPSKWFYRDPKNVVHGPWKASLMQAWYKDGLLPPDLPVRREEDADYVLLKDLRLQSVDPTHPFRSLPPPMQIQPLSASHDAKPLLPPLSLLSQPKHYGPPALFYSSRGGHSTTIVDARGRSVLKGRFVWSSDEYDDDKSSLLAKMGDVKRLEAFDVNDRSVIVAMRHGGLEAMDLGDALLKPADESRTILPQFTAPPSNTNRRGPFVWRIGTPISSSFTSSGALSGKSKGLSTPSKKHHAIGKSPSKSDFPGDSEAEGVDEVMFLGRTQDDIYLCERNAGTFRILHLCPKPSNTS